MAENLALTKRYNRTLEFMARHLDRNAKVLDLGTHNPFSDLMSGQGYSVQNTQGEDLDMDYRKYAEAEVDVVTAYEIFEHMLAPVNILRDIKAPRLIASVPLKLWFASAYWNEKDDWDKHYHEFEPKQFDYLMNRSGWKIVDKEFWYSFDKSALGVRPILRRFYPRYYIVYRERQ